jgi:hypothetical protein
VLLRLLKDLLSRPRAKVPTAELLDQYAEAWAKRDFAAAADALQQAIAVDPELLRTYAANHAHAVLLSQDWVEVSRTLGPLNMLDESGWLRSIAEGRPVDRRGRPVPWLTYPATEVLEEKIPPAARVFEWGAGHSTLWWAERAAEVFAIESNPAWAAELAGSLPANASVTLETDPSAYVAAITNHAKASFDVVVIDGDARLECSEVVDPYLKPDGVVVFDNSDRVAYRRALEALASRGWLRLDFFGLIPSYLYKNCTSVLFRDPAVLRRGRLPSDTRSSVGWSCSQLSDRAPR